MGKFKNILFNPVDLLSSKTIIREFKVFFMDKKKSNLIKYMVLVKFDFWKKQWIKKTQNLKLQEEQTTCELLHCSCLSKLKSWPQKPKNGDEKNVL